MVENELSVTLMAIEVWDDLGHWVLVQPIHVLGVDFGFLCEDSLSGLLLLQVDFDFLAILLELDGLLVQFVLEEEAVSEELVMLGLVLAVVEHLHYG